MAAHFLRKFVSGKPGHTFARRNARRRVDLRIGQVAEMAALELPVRAVVAHSLGAACTTHGACASRCASARSARRASPAALLAGLARRVVDRAADQLLIVHEKADQADGAVLATYGETVVLCAVQTFFVATWLSRNGIIPETWAATAMIVVTLTTGTIFVMWLGEKITDKGLGNGASMIIMVGILARLPQSFWQEWQANPTKFASKAQFARAMLDRYDALDSQPVIEGWCRDWSGTGRALSRWRGRPPLWLPS